jgi:hypothetical protein
MLLQNFKNDKTKFDTIQQYMKLILEQYYQNFHIYNDIEEIIATYIEEKPDICIQWYKRMLSKISDFSENIVKLKLQNNLESINLKKRAKSGLWLIHTEEIVEVIARHNSNELLKIMRILVSLWKKGSYIGSPKRLFESYKLVPIESLKIEIKKIFQKWYNSIKKLNPKIEEVDWD